MKLIIAGSRTLFPSYSFIMDVIRMHNITKNEPITEIVSGRAIGVDQEGEHFASHMNIPVKPFPVEKKDWDRLGKAAGPIRNKRMAEYADCLLLIWTGDSPGSKSMEKEMKRLNKPIYEVIILSK